MSAPTAPITFSEDCARVNWVRLAEIFRKAPLADREPARLKQVFQQSTVCCFVWDGDNLIAAGRAISDRISYAAIFDVVVAPEFQKRGIGTELMRYLMRATGAANIILHSVPGKEPFYAKLGFRRMKTAMARFSNPELQQRSGYIE